MVCIYEGEVMEDKLAVGSAPQDQSERGVQYV
jgi:hypothetical protein